MTELGGGGERPAAPEFAFDSIRTLATRLRRGEVSAVELAGRTLDRLRSLGRELNTVAELTVDHALEQARRADAAIADGSAHELAGIPWAPKDMLSTAGIPTRWGAPPFRDQIFDFDATVVSRLGANGAVMVAKLAMVEMAGAGLYRYADASIDGPCRNPWDRQRWAGGSSSGSAAAVAAGLVPFSIGSETAGSLVIPASFCGVTALRPTFGLVSVHGALPVAWSLDKLGPLCRNADDCAVVLKAVAGRDEADPTTREWQFRTEERSRFRLGVLHQPGGDGAVQEAFHSALEVLEGDLGMELTDVEPPAIDFLALHDRLVAGETAAHHEDFILSPDLADLVDEYQKATLRDYLNRPASSYPRAARERVPAVAAIRALFSDIDAIVSPTVLTEAVPLDEDLLTYRHARRGGNMFLGSIAGIPELTMPMGFGSSGLPIGISVLGDVLGDPTVLRIGSLYQSVTSWHELNPPTG